MFQNKSSSHVIFLILIGCLTMSLIEFFLSPMYMVKSIIKVILFLLIPIGYSLFDKRISFKSLFSFNKKSFYYSILLGILIYIFIYTSYIILGPYFDFSNVTVSLENNIGVHKNNFIFVALYISIVNSLLEEFFFRGFAFLTLKKLLNRRFAYIFSSTVFALYHITMMTNWFTLELFILLIVSLFVSGLLLDFINEKSNNIYASWIVHMFANLAINTVGFTLFNLI